MTRFLRFGLRSDLNTEADERGGENTIEILSAINMLTEAECACLLLPLYVIIDVSLGSVAEGKRLAGNGIIFVSENADSGGV